MDPSPIEPFNLGLTRQPAAGLPAPRRVGRGGAGPNAGVLGGAHPEDGREVADELRPDVPGVLVRGHRYAAERRELISAS